MRAEDLQRGQLVHVDPAFAAWHGWPGTTCVVCSVGPHDRIVHVVSPVTGGRLWCHLATIVGPVTEEPCPVCGVRGDHGPTCTTRNGSASWRTITPETTPEEG